MRGRRRRIWGEGERVREEWGRFYEEVLKVAKEVCESRRMREGKIRKGNDGGMIRFER